MFFRSLCPTVMLASVHSGVVNSSYGGRSVVLEKKKADDEREGEKENRCGPREKNEDMKTVPSSPMPVPSSPVPVPSSPVPIPSSPVPVPSSPKPVEEEEEDKENRSPSAGGVNKRRETRSKSSEAHRAGLSADNKLRSVPNRCLSPLAIGAHRALSFSKPKTAKTPDSPLPLRAITPLSNVQGNGWHRAPPAVPRNIPTSPKGSRRNQKPNQRSPLRITKSSLTLSPNQKLSIVYRNDRFIWDAKEVEAVKGY